MATYELKRQCMICGALIGDDNPDGLGSECREHFEKASFQALFRDQEWNKKFHEPEVDYYLNWLIDYSSSHKFRSEFKKSFVPSVIEQLQEKSFLSKKQKEIIQGFVSWESEEKQRIFSYALVEIGKIQQKIVLDFYRSLDADKKQNIAQKVLENYRQ